MLESLFYKYPVFWLYFTLDWVHKIAKCQKNKEWGIRIKYIYAFRQFRFNKMSTEAGRVHGCQADQVIDRYRDRYI